MSLLEKLGINTSLDRAVCGKNPEEWQAVCSPLLLYWLRLPNSIANKNRTLKRYH